MINFAIGHCGKHRKRETGVRGTGRPPTGLVPNRNREARMRKFMGSILKQREAKKNREIRKILTKEQVKRHKEYQKIRKKQINEMLKGMQRQSSPPPLL